MAFPKTLSIRTTLLLISLLLVFLVSITILIVIDIGARRTVRTDDRHRSTVDPRRPTREQRERLGDHEPGVARASRQLDASRTL